MRNNARTLRRAVGPAAVICAALALAACSETLGPLQGAPSKVAEVDADNPGANAGNIASLTDVIQRNPGDSVAYNTRGIAYAKAGNYKSAIEDFTKAVQIDPNFNAAYTNRALAFRQMGKDGPALADFNAAIAANPSDASAYLGRGNLLRSQNHLPEAMADLDAAIRLNPEGAQAYHARGLIYQRLGNNEQAITDFNNAIDRDPFAGAPYQARGQSLLATGKYDQAVDDFDAALNVDFEQRRGLGGTGPRLREARQQGQGGRVLRTRDDGRAEQFRRQGRVAAAGLSLSRKPRLRDRRGLRFPILLCLGTSGASSVAATRRSSQCAIAGEVVTSLQRATTVEHLLRVAEQHPVVLLVEQRVVDAGVARGHRALHRRSRSWPSTLRAPACRRSGWSDRPAPPG